MGLKSIHGFIVKTLNTTQEKIKNNKNIQKQHFKKIFYAQSSTGDFGFFWGVRGLGIVHEYFFFFFCRSVVFELRVKWEFNQLKLLEEADIGCTVLTRQSAKVGEKRKSGLVDRALSAQHMHSSRHMRVGLTYLAPPLCEGGSAHVFFIYF